MENEISMKSGECLKLCRLYTGCFNLNWVRYSKLIEVLMLKQRHWEVKCFTPICFFSISFSVYQSVCLSSHRGLHGHHCLTMRLIVGSSWCQHRVWSVKKILSQGVRRSRKRCGHDQQPNCINKRQIKR